MAGDVAQYALDTFKDPNLDPSILIGQLTTTCNSSSRGPDALYQTSVGSHMYMLTRTHTHHRHIQIHTPYTNRHIQTYTAQTHTHSHT